MGIRILMAFGSAAWLLALAVGCSAPPAPVGALKVEPASIDFGSVVPGTTAARPIGVRNVGTAPLTLSSLTPSNPDVTSLMVTFRQKVLQPQEAVELQATFAPGVDDAAAPVEASFVLHAEGTRPGEDTATIRLRGQPVVGDCEGVGSLDFGAVAFGDTGHAAFTVRNPTRQPVTVVVGAFTGTPSDLSAFGLAAGSNGGTLTLTPGESRQIAVEFRPTEMRSYSASIPLRRGPECTEQQIALTGEGVPSVLTWHPEILDYGYVTPGTAVTRDLVFSNLSHADIHLSRIATGLSSEFHVMAGADADPTVLDVPGMGSATLKVAASPSVLGPRMDHLTFYTDRTSMGSGAIPLKVFGGGPDIDLPASLGFGKVAYFAAKSGQAMVTRRLVVKSVGSAPAPGDLRRNLHLGLPDGAGGWAPPYLELTPLNDATAADEFSVSIPQSYDPVRGIEAVVGKNELALEVTVSPRSLGLKEAQLTVHSNDPDEPAATALLTADAVDLPSCQYSVSPGTLDFGTVTSPRQTDLQFRITNTGTTSGDTCLISGVDVFDNGNGVFSLPDGAVEQAELGAGESLTIDVRARPQQPTAVGDTPLAGSLRFFASSSAQPSASAALQANFGRACLEIAPRDFDFGNVKSGCASVTRTFSIYNTCSQNAALTGISLQAAAGLRAGEPGCTSGADCPEFELVQTPSLPAGGLTIPPRNAPVTFQVKYRPIDTGIDLGAIAMNETQGAGSHTTLGVLRASAGAQPNRTETLALPAQPKADVLLIIDNSGSMDDDQRQIVRHVAEFLQYAQSAQVDFHIASTTADMDAEEGRIVRGFPGGEKILVPGTEDLSDKLFGLIVLGSTGSGTEMEAEPALAAVTDPLVTTDNAGFLREDATLGLVALTDEPDQSPGSLSYYLDRLWNVKGRNAANRFTFSAIAGFGSACKQQTGGGDEGDKLAFYAERTGGATQDICTNTGPYSLLKIGNAAFGFRTQYFLGEQPELSSGPLEVRINSVPIPATTPGGATVWTYQPVANSVNFESSFAPAPGDTLEFSYPVACYQ